MSYEKLRPVHRGTIVKFHEPLAKSMGLYPLLVADYFSPVAHHEKGGCTPARAKPE
jgi:hypothetical protein